MNLYEDLVWKVNNIAKKGQSLELTRFLDRRLQEKPRARRQGDGLDLPMDLPGLVDCLARDGSCMLELLPGPIAQSYCALEMLLDPAK
ncbi:unnamed protein product [Prunus armeniaca]